VVVVGSGATAATLIPAIAPTAAHVTMLQRSPTFFLSRPRTHELATTLRALDVPEEWTHEILRRAHIAQGAELTRMSFESPDELRKFLIEEMRPLLPEGFDTERHFNPRYRPWQQRIAVVPEGDLFAALREGRASVVTDTIETFTETGIRLTSGDDLEADLVVTATGFDLSLFGEIEGFNPGYVIRSLHRMFKQGDREPWTHMHENVEERALLPAADLDDGLGYR
jgi:cation diffusion facilitator CzcD-associated flavoprotein CzcO